MDQCTAANSGSGSDLSDAGTSTATAGSILGADFCDRMFASMFGGAAQVARRRLIGTLFGVTIAAVQISFTPHSLLSYAAAITALGLICSLARLHPSAFRFGAIAMTVVVTADGGNHVWKTAATRFIDVALGILVALVVVRLWPNQDQDNH